MQVGNLYRNHRSLPGRAGYLLTLLSGIGLGYSGSPAVHVWSGISVLWIRVVLLHVEPIPSACQLPAGGAYMSGLGA